jgi:enoyl-CoA hydratase/carnithine racemase
MHEKVYAEGLSTTVQNSIGTITLNRPGRRNAISQAMWAALPAAVADLTANASVRLLVLRGANGHFAAGADISEFGTVYGSRAAATAYAALLAAAMDALLACPKPVIAAIQGNCIGGGVALTLCCDLSFADETANFAVTPAKLGIAYSFADTRRLTARIGAPAARDLLFSARRIDAAQALRWGLIDRLGPLDAEIAAHAALLANTSSASGQVAKDFIARALAGQVAENDATLAAYLNILEGPDFTEGRTAFEEKRPPRFK